MNRSYKSLITLIFNNLQSFLQFVIRAFRLKRFLFEAIAVGAIEIAERAVGLAITWKSLETGH